VRVLLGAFGAMPLSIICTPEQFMNIHRPLTRVELLGADAQLGALMVFVSS
jgi:hypothetical protein